MPPKSKKPFNKIDEEIEESFPASDPPSFNATFIGAPKRKKSAAKKKKTAKKKAAVKRPAKKSSAKKKNTYR